MNTTCITSVAFRAPYVRHSRRQKALLEQDMYYIKNDVSEIKKTGWTDKAAFRLICFHDELPHKGGIHKENIVAEFQKSLYGFKPHAIHKAVEDGFKKVIWLDPSVLPITDIRVLIDSLDTHPMITVRGDAPLAKMTNQKAKDWFGVTDEDIKDVKHIGGTIYGFNFNDPKVVATFNLWKEAEEAGIFGTQDEFMAGHWADESCMALAMFKKGIEQYSETKFKYLNQKEL